MSTNCPKCSEPYDALPPNGNGRTLKMCRSCKRQYDRDYYARTRDRNKEKKRLNGVRVRKRNQAFVREYLSNRQCLMCPESDPVVLEFDHRDPGAKTANISNMLSGWSLASLQEEIAKCDVLCANCHRKKTAKQQGWHSYLWSVSG